MKMVVVLNAFVVAVCKIKYIPCPLDSFPLPLNQLTDKQQSQMLRFPSTSENVVFGRFF